MPRRARVHYRSAFYHVMLRGNNRQNIFDEDEDYLAFLRLIDESAEAYNFKLHLYCLMTNHIHMVIEVGDIPISRIMQSISSRYAKLHNKKYDKVGHLFQGRFKSKLISDDCYLLELCYYIHMNPIKSKMCKSLDDYRWSSHFHYKESLSASHVRTKFISDVIRKHYPTELTYLNFMASYDECNLRPAFCHIGNDGFLDLLSNHIQTKITTSLALENISINVIATIVCNEMNIDLAKISSDSQSRRVSLARSMIAYFAHYHAKYTFEDIAAILCRVPRSISKTLRGHLREAGVNREISHILNAIERNLSVSDVDRWVM